MDAAGQREQLEGGTRHWGDGPCALAAQRRVRSGPIDDLPIPGEGTNWLLETLKQEPEAPCGAGLGCEQRAVERLRPDAERSALARPFTRVDECPLG